MSRRHTKAAAQTTPGGGIRKKMRNLVSTIEDALIFDVYDDGDTEQVVDIIFNGVVKVLRCDARFPQLTRTEYDLLFADVANEARATLQPYSKINPGRAAEVIAEALVDEANGEGDAPDPKAAAAAAAK
jgi:hypothetical protein